MLHKIIDRRPNTEHNMQYPCYPDELLRKKPSERKISPRKNQGDAEDKDEEDDGVGV